MKSFSLKTPEDIKTLKWVGARHAKIIEVLSKEVKSGVSTFDLNKKAENLVKEEGDKTAFLGYKPDGARRAYPASLCVSINDEIVHGIPNEKPKILKDGDIVSLDLGLVRDGLITDMAVTVPVGKVSKEAEKLIYATREALYAGIEAAVAGGNVGDIGARIEAVAKKTGFRVAEGLAGHGVGYAVHEDPYIPNIGKVGEGRVLEPGIVIAIEPMFTLGDGKIKMDYDGFTIKTRDGSLSAHFEHTVAITKDGTIILTELND